jgi:hypothetical protein
VTLSMSRIETIYILFSTLNIGITYGMSYKDSPYSEFPAVNEVKTTHVPSFTRGNDNPSHSTPNFLTLITRCADIHFFVPQY